jgi:murein DD-endopeptidase MepM/ murein hydrolase activator NlpD
LGGYKSVWVKVNPDICILYQSGHGAVGENQANWFDAQQERVMILLKPHATNFPITQHFGEHPDWYPKTNGHNGIDYGVPEGTQIRAAADGIVQRAELDTQTASTPGAGYGNNVRILHPDGSLSIYAHFLDESFLVTTGQAVNVGDPLGLSG